METIKLEMYCLAWQKPRILFDMRLRANSDGVELEVRDTGGLVYRSLEVKISGPSIKVHGYHVWLDELEGLNS